MADRPVNTKSSRSVVYAREGMVAASQPLAASAALKVLMDGGNAFDAAIAAAAVLCVVEPFMTGIGGDMFALFYDAKKGELKGLNGSGRSPYAADAQLFRAKGLAKMPERGIHSVTVPGAVDGWVTLLDSYGSKPFKSLLLPAINYAEEGYPVSEIISTQWQRYAEYLKPHPESARGYLINGKAPRAGQLFRQPNLAKTLRAIAEGGKQAFYEGEVAAQIVAYCNAKGGRFSLNDFCDHRSEWIEPISTSYHGLDVYELPPNSQGLCVLQMLNILEEFDLKSLGHNSADYLHLLVESKKMAFAHRDRFIGDPSFNELPTEELISKKYAKKLREKISFDQAREIAGQDLRSTDTVYLSVVDKEGNCVSFINSIYHLFGSALVAGDTGIILQNRGCSFSLEEGHFNLLEPHKRPLHTIIPAMVLKNSQPLLCFGVMGGDMQPLGHVQVILNMVHFGMNVQEAGEAPRVCHKAEGVCLESEIPAEVGEKLVQKGHRLHREIDVFGGFQGIYIDPDTKALHGGSDPRKDGCAIGF